METIKIKYINKYILGDITYFNLELNKMLYTQILYDNLFSYSIDIFVKKPPKKFKTEAVAVTIFGLNEDVIELFDDSAIILKNNFNILRIITQDKEYNTFFYSVLNSETKNINDAIFSFVSEKINEEDKDNYIDKEKIKKIFSLISKKDIDLLKIINETFNYSDEVVNNHIVSILSSKKYLERINNERLLYINKYQQYESTLEIIILENKIKIISTYNGAIKEDEINWLIMELNLLNKNMDNGFFVLDTKTLTINYVYQIDKENLIYNNSINSALIEINKNFSVFISILEEVLQNKTNNNA